MVHISQDADATLNLLVFEWLNNGFCEDDVKSLSILFAVHDLKSRPLRGNLSYAFTAISIAAFQCMVYQNNNLKDHYLSKEPMNLKEIQEYMVRKSVSLNKTINEECIQLAQVNFFEIVKQVDKEQLKMISNQINSVTQLRYRVAEYLMLVESNQNLSDTFLITRICVINSLLSYLNEQMEITSEVTDEITRYVKKLWELKPAVFEEVYLTSLSPATFIEDPWKYFTDFGLKFFKVLQPSTEHASESELKLKPNSET